jgi:guanosine-3',5'-bis(diphosphate) 3'-pyrophosphohydrolase
MGEPAEIATTPLAKGARLPEAFRQALEGYAGRVDLEPIERAWTLAVEAHAGQRRASGDEYVAHTIEVATILASLRLDTATIVAGLVHDVVEDTAISLHELEERFGREVATLVDGVTKIGKVQFRSHTEQQVENYRKLLLSMADDARVILIKLADRLHNMRTLEHLPEHKRRRIATETREIYAPLAHRLGIFSIKWELEDLCFKFLEPEAYAELTDKIQQRRQERERQIAEMRTPIEAELEHHGIPAEVTGRPKHLWSIYKKMRRRGLPYEEIYDLMAMRIITDSVQNCYHALGVIHAKWVPVQERFHDYIATPKSNMYRSLHTTVVGPQGRRYEIQIRTQEMHRTAEYGIAAHWKYKEGATGEKRDEVDEALTWFRQVLEWQQDTSEPEEFMEFLRMDLFQGEIFVFTPQGEVKQLPVGATPIDFAFAVHTEVGLHCAGAKVNGRIAPLSRELRNGDSVEILTNARQWPTRDWLAFVKTSRARGRVRQWIRTQEHDASLALGREFLEREVRKARLDKPTSTQMAEAAEVLNYPDFDHVLAALGRGDISPAAVLKPMYPGVDPTLEAERAPSALKRLAEKLVRTNKGVRIQGMENLMVRYSQCCQPVPGDDVVGYITRGRGVSIHRGDCPNLLSLPEPERRVEIEWAAEKGDRFMVRIYVRGTDRRGLLTDIARAITDSGTDIQHADLNSADGGVLGEFVVEVQDLAHLKKVLGSIGRVKGVLAVERRESFQPSDFDA